MNRTDRLLAIVLELQGKGKQRAEDLAATFETSKRTIYRDIQALSESGVPLISVPGQGYSLVDGYFLPPLSFTADEAMMLLLGSSFMARSFDAQYQAAAEAAGRKIAGALRPQVRDEVNYLRENIFFMVSASPLEQRQSEKLAQLRRAIVERVAIRFRYYPRYRNEDTPPVREADPYTISYYDGAVYLGAYDHARKAMRNFRLERIEALALLPRHFQRRTDLPPRSNRDDERKLTVKLLFDKEVARWAQENRSFFTVAEQPTADGLLVTLQVRQEEEVLQWLLSWGQHVCVLEPPSLRNLLREEIEQMLRNLQDSPK